MIMEWTSPSIRRAAWQAGSPGEVMGEGPGQTQENQCPGPEAIRQVHFPLTWGGSGLLSYSGLQLTG